MPLIPTNPGPALKIGWQVLNWGRGLARRDHSTVYRGVWGKSNFGRTCITLAVACGPSKRLRHGRRVDHRKVLEFLNAVVPEGFHMPPVRASADDVAFDVKDPQGNGMWDVVRVGQVYSMGLVELLVRPTTRRSDTDPLVVDLLSVARPIYDMASVVRLGGYRDLFGFRNRSRRVDWTVYLANFMSDETRGSLYWSDLDFPGRRPVMRATDSWPAAPNFGLGCARLRNRHQRADPAEIVRAVIIDLLNGSGWLEGNEQAIEDVLDALRSGGPHASVALSNTTNDGS